MKLSAKNITNRVNKKIASGETKRVRLPSTHSRVSSAGVHPQQRQGAPDAGVEMHDPVQQLFAKVQQAAMDMGRLAAVCAEVAARLGPAVGTDAVGVGLAGLARRLFDRACDQSGRDDGARPFDIHPLIPRSL
jgi:hypothetical protein